MSEEFREVTRKKWLTRKRLNQFLKGSNKSDSSDFDVKLLVKNIESLSKKMEDSEYFQNAIKTLDNSLLVLPTFEKFNELVCFGLGPISQNYQSFHQLAFILCLQRHYNFKTVKYFDPIFSQKEVEALEELDCTVMGDNCEGKYETVVPTVFYFPHCPKVLANNLLWRNWNPNKLRNIILINNSFESIVTKNTERALRAECSYILDIVSYTNEFPLNDEDYEVKNVFNDLSVHLFPIDKMPIADSTFWEQRPPPQSFDPEMIICKDIEKLIIA